MKSIKDFENLIKSTFTNDEEFESFRSETELIAQLVKVRLDNNMTQKELAMKSGLTQPTIAKIEGGVIKPGIDTLMKIVNALGVNISIVPNQEINLHHKDSLLLQIFESLNELKKDVSELKKV